MGLRKTPRQQESIDQLISNRWARIGPMIRLNLPNEWQHMKREHAQAVRDLLAVGIPQTRIVSLRLDDPRISPADRMQLADNVLSSMGLPKMREPKVINWASVKARLEEYKREKNAATVRDRNKHSADMRTLQSESGFGSDGDDVVAGDEVGGVLLREQGVPSDLLGSDDWD